MGEIFSSTIAFFLLFLLLKKKRKKKAQTGIYILTLNITLKFKLAP